jgi:hypothetical protein
MRHCQWAPVDMIRICLSTHAAAWSSGHRADGRPWVTWPVSPHAAVVEVFTIADTRVPVIGLGL